MNYKNPLLKSKKKDRDEIDISELSEDARRKILRINETYDAAGGQGDEGGQNTIKKATALPGEVGFSGEGYRYDLLRGKWIGTGNTLTNGYMTKLCMRTTSTAIFAERFTSALQQGELSWVDDDGTVMPPIAYNDIADFWKRYNWYFTHTQGVIGRGSTSYGPYGGIDETVKGTVFYANKPNILPARRIITFDNIHNSSGEEITIASPDISMKWYSYHSPIADCVGFAPTEGVFELPSDNSYAELSERWGQQVTGPDEYLTILNEPSFFVDDDGHLPSYVQQYPSSADVIPLTYANNISRDDWILERLVIKCGIHSGTNTIDISIPISKYDRDLYYCYMEYAPTTASSDNPIRSSSYSNGVITMVSADNCNMMIEIYFRSFEPNV